MDGRGVQSWLAFFAGVGTGYTLGVATYRWLWNQGEHQLITTLANSIQSLSTEVSHLRQTVSEAGTRVREVGRASLRSVRAANSFPKKEVGGESEREEEDDEEVFYEVASLGSISQVERLELSNSSEELKEFMDEMDTSLREASSNEEICTRVLDQLRQKVEEYPEREGKMCFSSLRTTEVLWRAGCACRHQSAFHKKHNDTANEIKLLEEGFEYTDKAVKINGDNWQAQKWHAILIGATIAHKGIQDRITGGYKFKEHIDIAIQLKPDDSSSHHMLGRWQYEVAGLSWLERKAAGALFATPPTSTYEEALESFSKAENLKPNSWKSNLLWLAKCHLKLKSKEKAVEWLEKAWNLETVTPEDEEVNQELKKLLVQYLPDKYSQY